MITYVEADLFTSPAQTLVNTVNTVGVMGKGIAKRFRTVYPDMFEEYRQLCDGGEFVAGRLLLYRTRHKWVLNFPTKRHWRRPSHLDDIDAGLQTFRQTYAEQGIVSVAFPQLGCGNGGLDWETQVRPLMERWLASLPIDVYVHIAGGAPGEDMPDEEMVNVWLRSDPLPLPCAAFQRDLADAIAARKAQPCGDTGAAEADDRFDVERAVALDADALCALWRRLRTYGYLVADDVGTLLALPAEPVLDVLAELPYIAPTRVSQVSSSIGYDGHSTRAMLHAPEARGVQTVLPLVGERPGEPMSQDDEDGVLCSANRTISQLALFLTS